MEPGDHRRVLGLLSLGLAARAANIGVRFGIRRFARGRLPLSPEPTLARSIARYVNDEPWTWISSETLHFIGLSLLVGIVLLIDLRALGVLRAVPFTALERLLPWAVLGFGVNIVTGMLFFVARPDFYTENPRSTGSCSSSCWRARTRSTSSSTKAGRRTPALTYAS